MELDRPGKVSALERARLMSQSLSDAARRARFSARTRRNLTGGGFGARRDASLMRWVTIVSFWLIAGLPTLGAVLYYGFLASDQYYSEAQFAVSGGESMVADGLTAVTGIPSITTIQDTQIIAKFLVSRAAVEKINERADLIRRYSTREADWYARFNKGKPIENFVRYWEKMVDVSIKMPGGILNLKVRAFQPEDAQTITQAAVDVSEELINDLNQRMYADAVKSAQQDVERSAARLANARISAEKARSEAGILDVGSAITSLGALLNELKASTLTMQREYQTQLRSVSEDAPQMRNLRARITAANAQIAELESRFTSTRRASTDPTVAESMTRLAIVDLEKQIAERIYTGAVSTLEVAQMTTERKRMYLNTFVRPALPQEAQYPRRLLSMGLFGLLSCLVWGALLGIVSVARNHMA